MSTKVLSQSSLDKDMTKGYRFSPWLFLLLIAFVGFRKLIITFGYPQFWVAVFLLTAFTMLYLTKPALTRRFDGYHTIYFLIQFVIVETLGLLQPYEDTWGMLYIILGVQLRYLPSPRAALAWASIFTAALLVTMIYTMGLLPGLGFSLLIIALAVFFFAYDLNYAQAEAAKQESQKLLEELQAAHSKLKDYAAQAEELAAEQERDRLIRELHDSVSQMIFSISLTTESARLLLEKDPRRVPEALNRLQELTGGALAQMRALISQWRPS